MVLHTIKDSQFIPTSPTVRINPSLPSPIVAGTMCLLLACLIAGCSRGSDSHDAKASSAQAAAPPPALIRVQEVRHEKVAPRLIALGTVRPRHVSIIASAADGIVDSFPVEKGSFVRADTVLSSLRIFSTELALAEQRAVLDERQAMYAQTQKPRVEDVEEAMAQQLAAEASLVYADRRLKELKSLASRGATNQSAVDDAVDLHAEAKQRALAAAAVARRVTAGPREEEILQAKARLDAQQQHVAWLEAEKKKRITHAPFDGFVVSEETYLGQWLSKGDPVVRMAMLDDVDVEIPVDQGFISQISVGTEVHLQIAGTPAPDTDDGRWLGTVQSIVPRSGWESGSRSFPVIVRTKNEMTGSEESPIPTLREGMMAEVEFFGTLIDAIMVPKDCLVRTSRGTFVYAVNPVEDNTPLSVRQVMVTPGISKENWIQVTTTELAPGTQVVTEGAERLRPFQAVSIIPEAEK